jgi:Domain of unknown function (DUF397)
MDGNRAITWRKSSYSGNSGGQCVEVSNAVGAPVGIGRVLVRDTKGRHGPVLAFSQLAWRQFVERVKAGA